MRKIVILVAIFPLLEINAQNYLISFAGTGASTLVSSVKVENLTSGTSLTLNGSDILRLTTATGFSYIENSQSPELKIYPNPMTDDATLEFYPPNEGDAIIVVYDITGKPVIQIQNYLENSRQDFSLSGLKNGFYLVNVKGDKYQLSGKLISNGKSNGKICIEKLNNVIQSVNEKVEKPNSKGTQATVDMAYTNGDRLKYTGVSGNFSTVIIDIPTSNKSITFNFIVCTDGDNNNYPVVSIGTQVWMAENLKTTKYNDVTIITNVPDNQWAFITPGYCWYNNDAATYKVSYGALYNWYGVDATSNGGKNVCPTGWHVPSDDEWNILASYLGGKSVAGGKLKEVGTVHWLSPNTGATNETGFTALPCGNRSSGGSFDFHTALGQWWSSTKVDESSGYYAYRWGTQFNFSDIFRYGDDKRNGLSVRCVKDN